MPTPAYDDAALIPAVELQALFHCSERIIRRWVAERTIPSVKIGGSVFVRRADIDAMLAPARSIAARIAEAEATGVAVLTPAQLSLVRRVLADALDALPAA